MNHGTYRAYRHAGCRCDPCRAAAAATRKAWTRSESAPRKGHGVPDDGYVDPVAVERLLNGTLSWRGATITERCEAGRIALTREGGYAFCQDVLRLNGRTIARLRDEVAA